MYSKNDKRRIYRLIETYLAGRIDEKAFCSDFVPLYDTELDYDTLSDQEHKSLSELGKVASRFSQFEEDHKEVPGFFYTKEQLKQKIVETKGKLKKHFEELEKAESANEDEM